MGRLTDHEDLVGLLGAYALDAVEAEEAELVERHLPTCPRCRDEVAQHREVAGLLGYIGHTAPEGLWDRITASMQEPPPALRLDRVGPSAGLSARADGGAPASLTEHEQAAARRDSRTRRRVVPARTVALLAAAAAIVVIVLGVQVIRLDHRTGSLNSELSAMADSPTPTMAMVHQALAQPGAQRVALSAPGGGPPRLDAVILTNGSGYVYDSHLAPLPSDHTYQLWGVVAAPARISYGLLGSNPGVVAFRAGSALQALAVTAEPAGGVISSQAPVVATGRVISA